MDQLLNYLKVMIVFGVLLLGCDSRSGSDRRQISAPERKTSIEPLTMKESKKKEQSMLDFRSSSRVALSAAESHGDKPHLKDEDGNWRWTNELIHESSPYLLQHAHNPVNWYPWGEKAFSLAREQNKPIFLSIGYSTCYWCHVMERQCFEKPDIAAVMNEHFICIKVDREERPDVDDIYMAATQIMTRSGGWPMSVFLKPDDLKPFWCGTYVPPTPQYGRPGFPELMLGVTEAWEERREDVEGVSDRLSQAVTQQLSAQSQIDPALDQSPDAVTKRFKAHVHSAFEDLMRMYEPTHGGFGNAPKFPTPSNIQFLMAVLKDRLNHGGESKEGMVAIRHTLDRMARGGMYDQIGGGFHRYSTDEKWLVPHFEKMLYDNGQLMDVYLEMLSFETEDDEHVALNESFKRVVRETCDYVIREMTSAHSTYYSAQDAEVNHLEGGNYIWTPEQYAEAISGIFESDQDITFAQKLYGVNLGTNFQDPHQSDAEKVNVLYRPIRDQQLASSLGLSHTEYLEKKRQLDHALLVIRDKRDQPGTDDKTLVSWNGLMIDGMARAARVLNEPAYLVSASGAMNVILKDMCDGDQISQRVKRGTESKQAGVLEDYAFLVRGLISLHRTQASLKMSEGQANLNDLDYLDWAERLTSFAIKHFGDAEGGYYDTLADQSDLFVRSRSRYDGAIPSGNSQLVNNLIDLYQLTGNKKYAQRASLDLVYFESALKQVGPSMAHMQHAAQRAINLNLFEHHVPTKFDDPNAVTGISQSHEAVKLSYSDLKMTEKSIRLTIAIELKQGVYLNRHEPYGKKELASLVPTTIELASASMNDEAIEISDWAIKTVFPAGTQKLLPWLSDSAIEVYDQNFKVDLVLTAGQESLGKLVHQVHQVHQGLDELEALGLVFMVHYQACSEIDKVCMPPAQQSLKVFK